MIDLHLALDPALLDALAGADAEAAITAELTAALDIQPKVTLAPLPAAAPRADRGLSIALGGRTLGLSAELLARAESVATGTVLTAADPPRRIVDRVAAGRVHAIAFVRLAARAAVVRHLAGDTTTHHPDTIEIHLATSHLRALTTAPGAPRGPLASVREALRLSTGIDLPPIHFVRADDLAPRTLDIRVRGPSPLPWIGVEPGDLAALDHLAHCLGAELAADPARLVDRTFVDRALTRLRGSHPALVDAVDRRAPRDATARALRLLAAEGVSLRDLRSLLGGIAEGEILAADEANHVVLDDRLVVPRLPDPAEHASPALLAALARLAIKRALVADHAGNPLRVHPITPAVERVLASAWPDRDLPDDIHERIARAVRDRIERSPEPAALVTLGAARPALARIVAADLPDLRVFAYQELPADLALAPLPKIDAAL